MDAPSLSTEKKRKERAGSSASASTGDQQERRTKIKKTEKKDEAKKEDEVDATGEDEVRYLTPEVREHLEKHGWARIKGVVPAEATAAFKKGVEQYYKLWDPQLTFDNPTAWKGANVPPGTIHGIDKIGGHAWFMWELRQRPEIVRMWAEYFGCPEEDLRVSFDGFCVYLARTPRRNAGPAGHWGHFDHGTKPKPFKCLQSIVVMEDCMGEHDGGLVVWDKSHRAHDGYFKVKGITCKDDWHLFPHAVRESDGAKMRNVPQPFIQEIEKDARLYLADDDPDKHSPDPVPMERIRVRAEEGDVVIWYSDTAHQNQAPTAEGRDRIVAYVSMAPVKYILKREFALRRRAFEDRATSSHWAACGFKRNGLPRTYSTEQGHQFKRKYAAHKAAQPRIKLTNVGKRLAGVYDEPYNPLYHRDDVERANEEEEDEDQREEEMEMSPEDETKADHARERLKRKINQREEKGEEEDEEEQASLKKRDSKDNTAIKRLHKKINQTKRR